jgi:hypothetical protein
MAVTPPEGETTMNREHEHDDLIDLGAASVETRGTPFGSDDHKAGLIPVAGLSDE